LIHRKSLEITTNYTFEKWLTSLAKGESKILNSLKSLAHKPSASPICQAFGKWLEHNEITHHLKLDISDNIVYSTYDLDKRISAYRTLEIIDLMKEITPPNTNVDHLENELYRATSEINHENSCLLDDLLYDLTHEFEKFSNNINTGRNSE
ncbi:hypothetical protein L1D29_18935, partial [Shewanella insulae]|uniref:hypothetical protein n=1 Tax=Shewanella insulae TaxID=2681496 RepID=UPI001EFD65DD